MSSLFKFETFGIPNLGLRLLNFFSSLRELTFALKTSLSPLDFNHVCSTIETKASKIKERNSRKLEKKFNNLKRKFGIPKVSNLKNENLYEITSVPEEFSFVRKNFVEILIK